jgi:hypothetical protein
VRSRLAAFTFASSGTADATAGVAGGTTLTTGVFAQQSPPYMLTATACWYLDGLARNLCSESFTLPFGAGATPAPAATGKQGNWNIEIHGVLGNTDPHCPNVKGEDKGATLQMTETQLTGTWHYRPFCGANGAAVSGTMSASVGRNADGLLELRAWTLTITTASKGTCASSGTIHAGTATFAINSPGVGTGEAFVTPTLEGCPDRIQLAVQISTGPLEP